MAASIDQEPPSAVHVTAESAAESVERGGFAIVPRLINANLIELLKQDIGSLPDDESVRRRTNVYGVRNLLEASPAVRKLAASREVHSLVSRVLGENCFAVRATFFDKVVGANWNLRLHQDGVISVKEKVDTPGFSAWSEKVGVWQVRPPESVLQGMLAVRVHLDDCPRENGALRVRAGSHQRLLSRDEIVERKSEFQELVCEVPAGGALLMRPLLLHASSAAEAPAHRRVVHIEFAAKDLPAPLEWATKIGPAQR